MFERFTERARQAVVLAQEEARALGHGYIGTEHLLLGILREEGAGARVLGSLGVTVEDARMHVARIVGRGDEQPAGQVPFTPQAKHALELALREALSLGRDSIGTEHVLLGLMGARDGVAAQVLERFGLEAKRVRQEVVSSPSEGPPKGPERPEDVAYARAWLATLNEPHSIERGGRPWHDPLATLTHVPGSEREPTLLRGILIGWTLALVTLGAGLLAGRLIWG